MPIEGEDEVSTKLPICVLLHLTRAAKRLLARARRFSNPDKVFYL